MPCTELDPHELVAAAIAIPENTPVVMLNLLRYNDRANYGEATEFAACSGREAYLTRYAPAFAQVAAQLGLQGAFRVFFLGSVLASVLVPKGEQWHDAVLVEYDSFDVLRQIIQSMEYERIADPHRKAALADWRFIATRKQNLP